MSNSLQPLGLQYTRLPCPSPSPRACSNSCPLNSQWFHPTISSSVIPFSSCPQSFPASGSFPMSWLFTSGGQGIEASASASVLPVNIQNWFPLGLTGLILQSTRLMNLLQHHSSKASILWCSVFIMVQLCLFYGPTVYTFSPSICHKVMEPDVMILVFWMLSFKPAFSLSYFIFIKRIFNSSSLSAVRVVSSVYPAILIPACASFNWLFTWCTLHIS